MPSESDQQELDLVTASGAWPFITHWSYQHSPGVTKTHHSRHLRKGFRHRPVWSKSTQLVIRSLWMPSELNWWIGIIFAIGASLFSLGSILFLFPDIAAFWSISESQANLIFFLGSIPFTTAAYLQLFQAANADRIEGSRYIKGDKFQIFGWYPHDAGWLSCALQFIGTVLFNLNTFDAMHPASTWIQQDIRIWIPNILGSILFLTSGYIAFTEICHSHWTWQPDHISWWVGFINLLGCVGFMISAVFAFFPPEAPAFDLMAVSLWFTLLGALAFLSGAILLLPETVASKIAKDPNIGA